MHKFFIHLCKTVVNALVRNMDCGGCRLAYLFDHYPEPDHYH